MPNIYLVRFQSTVSSSQHPISLPETTIRVTAATMAPTVTDQVAVATLGQGSGSQDYQNEKQEDTNSGESTLEKFDDHDV